jgi:hypothetical protein
MHAKACGVAALLVIATSQGHLLAAHLSHEVAIDTFHRLDARHLQSGATACPLPGQPCTTASTCAYSNASAPNYCVYAAVGNSGTCSPATAAVRGDAMFGSTCNYYASLYSHAQCQGFDPWCVISDDWRAFALPLSVRVCTVRVSCAGRVRSRPSYNQGAEAAIGCGFSSGIPSRRFCSSLQRAGMPRHPTTFFRCAVFPTGSVATTKRQETRALPAWDVRRGTLRVTRPGGCVCNATKRVCVLLEWAQCRQPGFAAS